MTDILADLLVRATALDASDLHLGAGEPITWRIDGELRREGAPIAPEATESLARGLLSERLAAQLDREGSVDLATTVQGTRFRLNVFKERGRLALAARRLEDRIRTIAELRLPPSLAQLADLRDGLVLVTGPTGSGKTTTLATLLHTIHARRACHILTLEDPIEYVHKGGVGLVRQREVPTDVPTFAAGLRAALREDPDVLLIGEMRDAETIRAAVMAAETGHLVYSTLHSGDSVGAIERLLGALPSEDQAPVRHQLSLVLRAVVAQRLLKRADGPGRVPAVELLLGVPAVQNLIRTSRTQAIYSTLEAGGSQGMQTLEQSLAELVAQGLASHGEARVLARDPKAFEDRVRTLPKRGRS